MLDGVSFDAAPGEVVALVGVNGAGKTTLLHGIAGLLTVEGRILLDGRALTARRARHDVALCSSADRSFYYRLSLRENLRFFGRLLGVNGDALDRRIDDALDLTDLSDFADRRYSNCSTGTRQRLTFARALLSDAPVFLLDEPTRAVDPLHAQMLHTFIRRELAERMRKIIVLATNVLEEAWSACDRIVLLSGGRTIAVDTPSGLTDRLAKRVRYRLELEREDPDLLARLSEHGDVRGVDGNRVVFELPPGSEALRNVLREIVRGESSVRAISAQLPAAEDLFERGEAL